MPPTYPLVRACASEADDPTAELQQDYEMSDPDRTKIKPLKSVAERLDYFGKVVANETNGE